MKAQAYQVYEELLNMDLSIVTTLYCSALHLEEFYARTREVAERVAKDFETHSG